MARVILEGTSAARFFAAMAVLLLHLIVLPKLPIPGYLNFIPQFGGLGVPLFYLLSAFALSYGYFNKLDTTDKIFKFYRRRFFRIAPFYYFMLVFTILFHWYLYGYTFSIGRIFTSVTFSFNLFPGHEIGIVWASWSVGVEMLFYLIFPLIMRYATAPMRGGILFAVMIAGYAVWSTAFVGATGAMKSFSSQSLFSYIHFFGAGIFAFFVWRSIRWTQNLHHAAILAAMAVIILLIITSDSVQHLSAVLFPPAPWAAYSVAWAIALGLLVIGLGFARFRFRPLAAFAILGEASFSIYLWHPVVINFFSQRHVYSTIYASVSGDLWAFLACLALTLAIVLPLSWATYTMIERRFYHLGSAPRARDAAFENEQATSAAVAA